MSDQPLISIIVPVYNAQAYLSKCIESLISQTYKNIEIIFVNDGSKDDSIYILRKYTDDRIKIIDKVNEGVSAARNDGIKAANGQYVMFVDADDWIDEITCETAVNEMIKHNADIVMWSYISENVDRSDNKEIFKEQQVFTKDDVKNQLHRRFIGIIDEELSHPELADSLCPVWGKLYSKSILKNLSFVNLDDIGTYEDGLFNLYAFEKVNVALYIPEYFYHYRRSTTESVTSGYRKCLFQQWQNLFSIMKNYIQEKNLNETYIIALKNRVALSILGLGLNELSSDKSCFAKIKEIKRILSTSEYREAYRNLEYQYFPIHWKVFYKFAKYRMAWGVYALLVVITKIIH